MRWHGDTLYRGGMFKPFRERGGCLLIWLIFTIGGSFLLALYIFSGGPQRWFETVADLPGMPEFPSWHWTFSAVSSLVFLVCGIGIWMWKKWGFYGYLALTLIWLVYVVAIDAMSFYGLVGIAATVAVAWYVVTPYWEDMD